MNADVVTLLTVPAVRDVFNKVAKERTIRFKKLQNDLGIERDEAFASLNKLKEANLILKEANLIKEHEAAVEDFTTFYVTAEGLSVERELRNLR